MATPNDIATIHREAERLLAAMLGPEAVFRDSQREAIARLVSGRERLLLVQRTGWGKSLVYFLTTRMLRNRGAGPALLVSPLLALMRNQIDMAARIGIRAETINSSNAEEWRGIEASLLAGEIDILLISPERLGNPRFAAEILPALAGRIGLFVVDEAHCISDWGHDFRPDYRRIVRVLERLPKNIPILATTATANSRVVEDVLSQLGNDVRAIRGSLDRPSLRLQNFVMPSQAERMAWLAEWIPRLPCSGIVYCLTVPDVKRVASFLDKNGIRALPYWGALDHEARLHAEDSLIYNRVKALVATTALGMGYDKPDLGFVIHFQSPGSLVAYYQQVGRAGRALPEAYGVMMAGAEDEDIHDYFISAAFPSTADMTKVLAMIEKSGEPMSAGMIGAEANIATARLALCLKMLEIDGAIKHWDGRYRRSAQEWIPDAGRRERVTKIRRAERARVLEYAQSQRCLMRFLVEDLDGFMEEDCGRCAVCAGGFFKDHASGKMANRASLFLKSQAELIPVKKRWPTSRDGRVKPIPEEHRLCEGYALSVYNDAGWGSLVAQGKYRDGRFGDELVRASADFIRLRWLPEPPPEWITYVPSLTHPRLVADFAERLAERLNLPLASAVEKSQLNEPQKLMENSYMQAANAWRAFSAPSPVPKGACLLIDDIVDSAWTLTVIGVKLRQAGAGLVYPFALASAAKGK
ncbi:MAG: RecQ family ATP-dependent DNA helicase [Candidatus Sumerlaeota bacterium]|nr:RecQ family ATP-dependent DNA helicase [Candidatus Sumerlaeota bacterium]